MVTFLAVLIVISHTCKIKLLTSYNVCCQMKHLWSSVEKLVHAITGYAFDLTRIYLSCVLCLRYSKTRY